MSLILTKVIVSAIASGSSYHWQSDCTTYGINHGINPTTFLLTYGAMIAYDTYCYLKGEIKTFNTSVDGKITEKKEYRINEIDWVKYVANLLPLEACAASAFFNCDPEIIPYFCAAGIALETVADALNLDWTTTIVHEINSNSYIHI
jgi:hypothetical protein